MAHAKSQHALIRTLTLIQLKVLLVQCLLLVRHSWYSRLLVGLTWCNFHQMLTLSAMQVRSSPLIFAAHDCELNFIDVSQAAQKVKSKPDKVIYKGNPFLQGIFANDSTFIACGYDKVPYLFKLAGGNWNFVKSLDDGFEKVKEGAQITKDSFDGAQTFFKKAETERATAVKLDDDVGIKEMNTKHSNYINYLRIYAGTPAKP